MPRTWPKACSWQAFRLEPVRLIDATQMDRHVMQGGRQSEAEDAGATWVDEVHCFWFGELSDADWFKSDDYIDARIRDRFLPLLERLVEQSGGGAATPRAMLAAVIVLDQFSRNVFRGDPRAYAADPIARRLAKAAIGQGFDTVMTPPERMFLYMPFQHSEDRGDQLLSVNLCKALGNDDWTDYAVGHKAIIDRFGRFPHRNAVLGRPSTPEEIEFLKTPAS
jgi:uncharacterized protein (DUF924 family)